MTNQRKNRRRPGRQSQRVDQVALRTQLDKAAQRRATVSLPEIRYPEQLPVSAHREEISRAIAENQVVIVAGETGSGKTTQIPKIALELGRGRTGQIGHTQPRRIAARTVAERIAEELRTPLGGAVGYQVRFTDSSSDETLVKVMTDGILLAQIQRDPQLLAYDTLIIDEAHERSLNIDFILGYLARLLPRRPDLKLIVTSATIDSERFATHFGTPEDPAPIIEVSGRTYPVEIRYRPLYAEDGGRSGKGDKDQLTGIIEAVQELCAEGPGDILVFLSGEREILDTAEALEGHFGPRANDNKRPDYIEILPLYARLSAAEQHRVFQSHPGRRIVLATNVAETSLTVPGIRYVVDPGTARISRYSRTTKVQRLPIEPISQASANQRSGRCGRVAEGIAIRLYSQADFEHRDEFTEPEILRTSLASVLLQMMSVGVVSSADEMAQFPFVDPPDTRAVRDGVMLLTELGALRAPRHDTPQSKAQRDGPDGRAARNVLTSIGRKLALLPMDPRLGRMILEASRHGVTREVMVITAALSVQDPRERPTEERAQADQLHARFADPTSDFLTYLNLWEYLREQQRALSSSAFRRLCRAEYINFLRVREWQDVVAQLRELAKSIDVRVNVRGRSTATRADGSIIDTAATGGDEPQPESLRRSWPADLIHRSLLAGLLSQIGMQDSGEVKASAVAHLHGAARERALKRAKKQARNEYLGSRGARFAIFPGSPLSKKPPAFVMAGELVETSRLWARDVAKFAPEWAEELAGPLARSTYSDPAWSRKRGAAVVREKVLLYGVPIVVDRKVLLAKFDARAAREMFIRHALVDGDWAGHHRFIAHNNAVRGEIEQIEARSRRRLVILDDEAVFAFFDSRIPVHVTSAAAFDKWWREARKNTPELLNLSVALLAPELDDLDRDLYPDIWPQGEWELPLTYQLAPGTDNDGITVHIPIDLLGRVVPNGFDWLVPGMRDELITATIRSLPKPIRVQLVPAPDVARDVAAWFDANLPTWADIVRAGDMAEPYATSFARAVRALRDVDVPVDAIDRTKFPAHLRMTYRATTERGGSVMMLDESDDLRELQRRLASHSDQAIRSAVRDALTAALAESGTALEQPASVAAVPVTEKQPMAKVSAAASAPTVTPPVPPATEMKPSAGFAQRLVDELALGEGRVTSRWSTSQTLMMASSSYSSTTTMVEDLQFAAAERLVDEIVQNRSDVTYSDVMAVVRPRFEDEVYRVVGDVVAVLTAARDLDAELSRTGSLALLGAAADIRDQTGKLLRDGFIRLTPVERLGHLARYVRAAVHRWHKAVEDPTRDGYLMARIHDMDKAYREAIARWRVANGVPDDFPLPEELADVRWQIEELRVSLFAQQLGTDGPVSEKRIHKVLRTPGW